MARRGGSTPEHAHDELRPNGGQKRRRPDRLIQIMGGPQAFRTRVLPGIAVVLALALGLTTWAVTSKPKDESGAGFGTVSASPGAGSAASATPTTQTGEVQPTIPRVARADTAGPWPTGVSYGLQSSVDTFADYRGRPNDVVVLFVSSKSWGEITDPWIGDSAEKFSKFSGTWVLGVPMFPGPAEGSTTAVKEAWARQHLEQCAAGQFDTYFKQFGTWLASHPGRGNSFVRIGWEFNGDWFPWGAWDPAKWRECYRKEALALRSTAPNVRLDWTVNAHTPLPGGGDPFSIYPGDDVVDVIGMDTYDQYPPSTDAKTFKEQCNETAQGPGLCKAISFARLHNKLFSVPEWGLVSKTALAGANAGGDNTVYISQMYQIFYQNKDILAYEAYYNEETTANVASSIYGPVLHPRGSALYKQLWSKTS